MARRVGLLLLVVLAIVGARLLEHRAVDVDLRVDVGPAASSVREVTLIFTDEHERVERDVRLLFPDGAPPVVFRRVRLHPGSYVVGARLVSQAGAPKTLSRSLHVGGAGTYSLEL
jgi:hypothetical protein